MATINTSQYLNNSAEAVHAGVNCLICRVSLSVTISVGDVHRIGKFPHGAIPIMSIFYGATAAGQGIFKFGVSSSNDLFFDSLTYSAAHMTNNFTRQRRLGVQQQNSLSDDAMPRYEAVTMVGTTNTITGYIGDLMVLYKMPGQGIL